MQDIRAEEAALIRAYIQSFHDRNLSAETIDQTASKLRKFSREVGIQAATEESIVEWLRRPSLQPQSRANWLTTLHVAYTFWIKKRMYTGIDPTLDIPKPKAHKGKPKPIPPRDLERALAAADPRMKCWLLLGCLCGCRCIEIANVRREDIHDEDESPWLHIVHGKGDKERIVPLDQDVLEALRALPMPESGRLWELDNREMSRAINSFLHKKVGTKFTAHTLRHRFGTDVYRASTDIRLTQELMGHSSPSTTAGYAAADMSKMTEVLQRMRGRA